MTTRERLRSLATSLGAALQSEEFVVRPPRKVWKDGAGGMRENRIWHEQEAVTKMREFFVHEGRKVTMRYLRRRAPIETGNGNA